MKLEDFDTNLAQRVIDIWEQHLGFWHKNTLCKDDPEYFAECVRNPQNWFLGRYEDRIGSRYTDDSKLLAYIRDGQLVFECYAQLHTVWGAANAREAELAEDRFNKEVATLAK